MKKTLKILCACLSAALTLTPFTACKKVKKLSKFSVELTADAKVSVEAKALNDDAVKSLADFSFSAFKSVYETAEDKRTIFSPVSLAFCLGLVANGTSGETKAEIESAYSASLSDLNENLSYLVKKINSDKTAETANSVWLRDGFANSVKSDYLKTVKSYYDAQVYASPFDDHTLSDINKWGYNATDGMIEKVIDYIDPRDVLYLINSLHFESKWKDKYEKTDIKKRSFTNENGETSAVDMLHSSHSQYMDFGNAYGVSKFYENTKYAFAAILPHEGVSLTKFVSSLTGEKFISAYKKQSRANVTLAFPEFSFDNALDLKPVLKAMGINKVFAPDTADFSAIADENLYLGFIKQIAKIDVSRNGTKAAAITIGGGKSTSAAPTENINVICDRPFCFAIIDVETALPLFFGTVTRI